MGAVTQVSISGNSFDVYGSVALASAYFAGSSSGFATWTALDANAKKRALVSGRRVLDRQRWKGTKDGGAGQATAFPRAGLVDASGFPITSTVVPDEVCEAGYELGLDMAGGDAAGVESDATGSVKSSSERVGGVSISTATYADPRATGSPTAARFPVNVMELIGLWLSASSADGAIGYGTDAESAFTDGQFGVELRGLP
ncbi:MAG TPA: DnaT-like ssDNA-binding protein [Polyangia bacterium]|nr:DnaT-like ssDNA-binding protein [Polyangia bacterium]